MSPRLICDAELRVEMDGGGERTLLVVTDGRTVRFWTETALMEAMLQGDPVQLSTPGGFCAIEAEKGRVRFSFGLTEHGVKRCDVAKDEFSDALAWVRSLSSPHDLSV